MTDVSLRTDPAQLAAEVDELAAERWRHTSGAANHRALATRLRQVAASIDDTAEPLAVLLDPVIALHTTTTWEGVAATAARERLDRHEERCWHALRSARGLAAELRAEAEAEDARARTDDALAGDLLRRIAGLELELGRFDHI